MNIINPDYHEIKKYGTSVDKDRYKTVSLQSPPSTFASLISVDQWKSLSDDQQDKIVEAAKVILTLS